MFDFESCGSGLAVKLPLVQQRLQALGSVVVAYSGGVDSALALKLAVLTLGRDAVLAVTGRSPSVSPVELESAETLAREIGARHEWLDTREFEDPNYLSNPGNRCYFCKTELYAQLTALARNRAIAAVINGVNADDLGDYRPGLQAAGEHGVHAPLAEAGITKADVRELAQRLGLSAHDKPASPCLSSRVQYGEEITPEKLRRIDAAEQFVRRLGFRECRVRHHGNLARLEVPIVELTRVMETDVREQIERELRRLGYVYVTVDLRGLRSGSLNDVLIGPGLAGGRRPT